MLNQTISLVPVVNIKKAGTHQAGADQMTELQIRHESNKNSGRYVMDLGDGKIAEMTYQRQSVSKISIDHTRVPPEFRGQNIAGKLMEYAIEQARRNKDKIVPVCSYVQVQFKRHKDWADLLAA